MIVSDHNNSCWGSNVPGHNHVWAQSCLGTIVFGPSRVWAQSCGSNHVWAQTWWNPCDQNLVKINGVKRKDQ